MLAGIAIIALVAWGVMMGMIGIAVLLTPEPPQPGQIGMGIKMGLAGAALLFVAKALT